MASRLLLVLLAVTAAVLFEPISRRAKIFGVTRLWTPTESIHGYGAKFLPDTPHTEDLHYHEPSGLIYGASEPDAQRRWKWYPPMNIFDDASAAQGQGTIITIDPRTLKVQRLKLQKFEGPFNTHGIDIWSPPGDSETVYIVAVNHVPNPAYSADSDATVPKARSRLDLFKHTVGSSSVAHVRSIWNPLIRTPNDVVAVSSTEFYVTNDHFYRDGALRIAEDLDVPGTSKQTDIVHVSISGLNAVKDDSEGVAATVAIEGIHNNNGLGYGSSRDEFLIGRAAAGVLVRAKRNESGPQLHAIEDIQVFSGIDNPAYFHDKYAKETGQDASGYVLGGLIKAITWPNPGGYNPIVVWLVQPSAGGEGADGSKKSEEAWTKKVIFQDDGRLISSCSIALLLPIDPATNGGKKQAQLFITGPVSEGVVATTVDL